MFKRNGEIWTGNETEQAIRERAKREAKEELRGY